MLFIHGDVVDPESGEVLAEHGEEIEAESPQAARVLAVCAAYPEYYVACQDNGDTSIQSIPSRPRAAAPAQE